MTQNATMQGYAGFPNIPVTRTRARAQRCNRKTLHNPAFGPKRPSVMPGLAHGCMAETTHEGATP